METAREIVQDAWTALLARSAGWKKRPLPATQGVDMHTLTHVALLVRDYDEAIAFYTDILGSPLSRTPTSRSSTSAG
jgi:glyoxalase/bleomycin resistance protein/dioxygenase superfamily protein